MTVIIVKLSSGEEIIGKVEDADTAIVITDPCVISNDVAENGNARTTLMRLAVYAKNSRIAIPVHQIVYTTEPEDEFEQFYNKTIQPEEVEEKSNLIVPRELKLVVPA